MLISVIVPVYNVEKYLVKCVESILHQTYKDVEVILVDDGSTDSSKILCDTLIQNLAIAKEERGRKTAVFFSCQGEQASG